MKSFSFNLFLGLLFFLNVLTSSGQEKTNFSDTVTHDKRISAINVQVIDMPGNTEHLKVQVKNLLLFKEGDLFSEDKLSKSLNILSNSGLFKAIHVSDTNWDAAEIFLTLQVTPFRRIKDIRISGAFPLLEKEILNAMTLYVGDTNSKEEMEKQAPAIEKLYEAEGYISPRVRIRAEESPEEGYFTLFIDIEKGDYYSISKVVLKGNKAFSSTRLKMRLGTWQSSLFFVGPRRFIKKDIKKEENNIIEFYRDKGYADVEIKSLVEKDETQKKVIISFQISEGPHYEIKFDGNKEFLDMTLKKELTLFRKGNKADLNLRRSLKNLKKLYKKAGYLEIDINTKNEIVDEKGKRIRRITFLINEGIRSITESVSLSGNDSLKAKRIQENILTNPPGWIADGEFVPDVLEADKEAIKGLYMKNGFPETAVDSEIKWNKNTEKNQNMAQVNLKIHEGIQIRLETLSFDGLKSVTETEALMVLKLKPGLPFVEEQINADTTSLQALISEKGYPYVQVKPQVKISRHGNRVDVIYQVDEGPFVRMGQVYINGNFRTRQKVFLNELKVETGTPFSLKNILEAQRNIRDIMALDTANFKMLGLEEKADEVDMLISVEEKKPYYFQLGSGYDTAREFFVNGKAGDRNLWGLNKEGWLGAEFSQIDYRVEAGLTDQRFFGTHISSTLQLYGEKKEEKNKDFGLNSYGSSLTFKRDLSGYLTASLGFLYEYREKYALGDVPLTKEEREEFDARNILVTTPAITYNSTDSYSRPKKGLYCSASVDISKGLNNDLDDFFKYRFETRYYYTLLEYLTFALRGGLGHIQPFVTGSRISDDQLFFLGGIADVRGFDENMLRYDLNKSPLGGKTEILGSVEARIDIGLNFELCTFLDMGNIKNTVDLAQDEGFRSSAGLGLRYITPIGPVGFMYGWKLDKKEGENSGKLHFAIGYTF